MASATTEAHTVRIEVIIQRLNTWPAELAQLRHHNEKRSARKGMRWKIRGPTDATDAADATAASGIAFEFAKITEYRYSL